MEEFPFSQEDWKLVEQASWSIANATVIEDDILAAAGHAELEQVLAELTAKYGEHPILVETAADFEATDAARIELYEQALSMAEMHGLQTYTIVLSLARLLTEDFGQTATAHTRLMDCAAEVATLADEDERREWQELLDRCKPSPTDESA